MASFIDLEDEDLINADENELYEENLANENDDNEENVDDPGIPNPADAPDAPDESAATRVPPKKKVVRNPQPKLDAERLKGPRGLVILESWFKDMKFKGKGHEKEDLDAVMCRLELWTHRLFPKFTFDDCLSRIEKLGHKKPVMNFVKRIRLDMEDGFIATVNNENDDVIENEPEVDPFDRLTGGSQVTSTTQNNVVQDPPQITLTQEQRERMIRNRLLAEERRLARAKARAEEELAKKQQESAMRESGVEVETEEHRSTNGQQLELENSNSSTMPATQEMRTENVSGTDEQTDVAETTIAADNMA